MNIFTGASVQGKSHFLSEPPIPCQDAYALHDPESGWAIAIVSDGAGSSDNSHLGSAFVTRNLCGLVREFIRVNQWIEKNYFPDNDTWNSISSYLFGQIRDGLLKFAQRNSYEPNSLHCTLILTIKTPQGILIAHVGDGRGGYRSAGEYKPLFKPYKGDMVGSTVFITNDYWGDLFESSVINDPGLDTFFITSDGCENFSFLTTQYDEAQKKYYDANQPFPSFYNSLISLLINAAPPDDAEKQKAIISDILQTGIMDGTEIAAIKSEQDDKTLVIWIKGND